MVLENIRGNNNNKVVWCGDFNTHNTFKNAYWELFTKLCHNKMVEYSEINEDIEEIRKLVEF